MTATAARPRKAGARTRIVPPILVRQVRNGIEESVHRGDVVEVDATGRVLRAIGDVERVVTLRSTVGMNRVLHLKQIASLPSNSSGVLST